MPHSFGETATRMAYDPNMALSDDRAGRRKLLHQWLTPLWVAEALVERHFAGLGSGDLVLEPSCGHGAFLRALPQGVRALGIEIDPVSAERCRRETGRDVVVGDFRSVDLDLRPTAVLGNPPFDMEVVDAFLDRSHAILPDGGRVGFVLPAYAFQTASRVVRYAERWSLAQEMIPRNVFPGPRLPLVFALFGKDRRRTMVGFALYRETVEVNGMPEGMREALRAGPGSPWGNAVAAALRALGGEAALGEIYEAVWPKRPTANPHWREKIRQTLNRSGMFRKIGEGTYALAA